MLHICMCIPNLFFVVDNDKYADRYYSDDGHFYDCNIRDCNVNTNVMYGFMQALF